MSKIFAVHNSVFTFGFFSNEEFMNSSNAKQSVDIFVESLVGELSGPNMWHFIYVLKSILVSRGERAARDLLIEVVVKSNY